MTLCLLEACKAALHFVDDVKIQDKVIAAIERAESVSQFVSDVCDSVTDEMIESMSGGERKFVADALRKQASRFYED